MRCANEAIGIVTVDEVRNVEGYSRVVGILRPLVCRRALGSCHFGELHD